MKIHSVSFSLGGSVKHKNLMEEVGRLLDEGWGYKSVARATGVHEDTARGWAYAYRVFGKEALLSGKHNAYTQEQKLEAVRLFLDEGLSKPQVMERVGIKSKSALDRWVRDYRAGGADALAPKPRGRRPKPAELAYATREEELEARVRELELELEIQKRINALADEIERKRRLR